MNKMDNIDEQGRGEKKGGLRKKIVPSLTLLIIIAVSVVIFYFYHRYPDMVEGLKQKVSDIEQSTTALEQKVEEVAQLATQHPELKRPAEELADRAKAVRDAVNTFQC